MRILVLGASHLTTPGYLITGLHDQLTNYDAKVHSLGVCGVTPSALLQETPGLCGSAERLGKSPPRLKLARAAHTVALQALVKQEQPDWLIIVMGDTLAGYREGNFSKPWALREVHQLTEAINYLNVRCIWVGPPGGSNGGSIKNPTSAYNRFQIFWRNMSPLVVISILSA